jgi:hypothetical protein
MRAKTLVTLAVCALCVFGFAIKANAQITHQVSSTPVDVVQTGVTEVMGEVRLVMINNPSHAAETTLGGTINILYQDVPITDLGAFSALTAGHLTNGKIDIVLTGGYLVAPPVGTVAAQVVNTAAGGLVTIALPAGMTIVEGDTITVNGVRATVTGKPVGADVNASIQSLPSNAHSFINVSTVRVARTNVGLLVEVDAKTSALCLEPQYPTIMLTEGFPGAFVQYVTDGGTFPANPRPKYGAVNNTQIKIQVVGVPDGVDIAFPATVDSNDGFATLVKLGDEVVVAGAVGSTVTVLYEFTTPDQGQADLGTQVFDVTLETLDYNTSSGVGSAVAWATLNPKHTATSTAVPRFVEKWTNDPPDVFLTLQKCRTYLLFPFLTNAAGSTFDSGMAVANTSKSTGVPGMVTTPQHGSVTIYGFPQFTSGGTAPTPISAVLASDLESGNTVAASLSGITGLAGFQGYAIVVCEFQYGHGFAYMSANYGEPVPVVAQGYLALVIPDPIFTQVKGEGVREASPAGARYSGENLGS